MHWFKRATFTGCLCALAALTGCSDGVGGGPYATVSGKVTQNGSPLADVKVQFISTTESGGARGEFSTQTNGSGEYMIAGVGDKPGIPPGMYKVVVTKLVVSGDVQVPEGEDGWDLEQLEMSGAGKNILPNQYGSYDTTNLETIVKEGANEDVNFDLENK